MASVAGRGTRSAWRLSAARIERVVVIAGCLTALLVTIVGRWPVSHEPGILAHEVPTQTPPRSPRLIEREDDGYQLTPLADYRWLLAA